mmetsp:Transcript_35088/g.98532  ORF Transcript_35088/g.98532 Transcript_35088/m.98532 type:complete len:239 (+) Transcript_35088:380-1096(+)
MPVGHWKSACMPHRNMGMSVFRMRLKLVAHRCETIMCMISLQEIRPAPHMSSQPWWCAMSVGDQRSQHRRPSARLAKGQQLTSALNALSPCLRTCAYTVQTFIATVTTVATIRNMNNRVLYFSPKAAGDAASQKSGPQMAFAMWTAATSRSPSFGPLMIGRCSFPVKCSSQVVKKKPPMSVIIMAVDCHVGPSCKEVARALAPITVLRASQPWSKSRPSGDPLPVLRACWPSQTSRSW